LTQETLDEFRKKIKENKGDQLINDILEKVMFILYRFKKSLNILLT
jgi:hypothetical protein